MDWPIIEKPRSGWKVVPVMADEETARASFTWEGERTLLEGLPGGGLNIAHEAVDRHAGDGARVALRRVLRAGEERDVSYAELSRLTGRFANLLDQLGVRRGERVFALMPRVPELYVAAFGTLKAGAVFSPLFPAFGPEPVRTRLEIGDGRVLVTTPSLYQRKVAPIRESLPGLRHVLVTGEAPPGTLSFAALMAAADERFTTVSTAPDDPALLHFTSGTTGRPKGAVHRHGAVIAHHATARLVLDLRAGDVFWCTADPGWVTGVSYGMIAPLAVGACVLLDEGEFEAERWCRILADERVTVWYTAPTAIRMLMRLPPEFFRRFDFTRLRHAASVGEPLNPEAVLWSREVLGTPFHDTWWQTETGAIMIANTRAADIRPGAMGRPVPGIEAAVVRRAPNGLEFAGRPGEVGEIALKTPWPSLFRGYLGDEERTQACFSGGWYLSGDLAFRDENGVFHFVGRGDDVIKSAGHLIGPFEVESVLLEHPAVAEAGVIGRPDPVAHEVVKAFVIVKPGFTADEALRRDIAGLARRRLGAAVAPREIEFP